MSIIGSRGLGEGLFDGFRRIGSRAYSEQVEYVLKNQLVLAQLPDEDYLEVACAYAEALFELGEFEQHIPAAQAAIACSFRCDVMFWQGQQVLCLMLFRIAASHYNTRNFAVAVTQLQELVCIEPNDPNYSSFLLIAQRKVLERKGRFFRGMSVLLFLVAIPIIAVEVLVLRNFYPDWVQLAETLRNGLIGSGILVLSSWEAFKFLSTWRKNRRFIDFAKKRVAEKRALH